MREHLGNLLKFAEMCTLLDSHKVATENQSFAAFFTLPIPHTQRGTFYLISVAKRENLALIPQTGKQRVPK